MAKIFIQDSASVLDYSGAVSGCNGGIGGSMSGSLYCDGYSRLVGGLYLAASLQSGSGFQVSQSFDGGTSWDLLSACQTLAAGTSPFSFEIFGDAVQVKLSNGSSANTIRTLWRTIPIQSPDLIGRLSASISGGSIVASSGSVVVTAGSVIVTNQVSASLSGGSAALLAGTNDVGLVHVGTGTCTIGDINNILSRVSASLASGSITVLSPAGSDLRAILETSSSVIGSIAGVNARISASIASGSVTTLSPAGSDLHAVLETSSSVIGVISGINSRVSASLASGSVTTLSPAGSDMHVVLETSTSSIGTISAASVVSAPWKLVWSGSGTLAGSNAGVGDLATSGTVDATGFGRLTGILYTAASLAAASGLRVYQSGNNGTNFDILSACLPAAAGASTFTYELFGNAVKVDVRAGSSEVAYRSYWFARAGQ